MSFHEPWTFSVTQLQGSLHCQFEENITPTRTYGSGGNPQELYLYKEA